VKHRDALSSRRHPSPTDLLSSASIYCRQAGLSFDKLACHEKGRCAPAARGAATPADPCQAGGVVQLGPPAGHGEQLRPRGGGQLVLKLLPFRRARSSTAPEQRTGPRCTSLLAAPRLGLGQRPRCLSVSAPQVRRTGRPGRHGRRRVAGRSLSALTSLRNGRRGAPPGRAAHCSGAAAAPRASHPLLPCSRRRCAAAWPVAGGLGRRRRPADRPVIGQRARNGRRWWRDLALRLAHAG
jgi:hypothetical protein